MGLIVSRISNVFLGHESLKFCGKSKTHVDNFECSFTLGKLIIFDFYGHRLQKGHLNRRHYEKILL